MMAPTASMRARGPARRGRTRLHACLLVLLFPATALAQAPKPEGRFQVSANGGEQFFGDVLAQTFTLQRNLETAPVSVGIDGARAVWFDGGIAARIRKQVGASVAVSYARRNDSAAVSAAIPHPFFFNQPRSIAGAAASARRETAVHIDAVYFLTRGNVLVLLSGGPSIFYTARDVVTDVAYTDTYPYDTATFASAATARVTRTAAGYNLSADVIWRITPQVGVGGLARFSRASATFTAAPGNAATSDLGGIQVGGGVRFAF